MAPLAASSNVERTRKELLGGKRGACKQAPQETATRRKRTARVRGTVTAVHVSDRILDSTEGDVQRALELLLA